MKPIFSIFTIAAAFCAFGPFADVQAGSPFNSDLRCDADREVIEISVNRYGSEADNAYSPDAESRRIIFNPSVSKRIPGVVVKLQFAVACLTILGESADTCAAVRFLRFKGELNNEDVSQLESYYLGRSKRDRSAYKEIREVYRCY